ncbi:hypothetical protein LO771_17290 [Streptacidiphilus sp. ASG 303]|uniref:WXG100-like domain-containing protein n=1 Tax=Streptacidiphilus sp. ASG 303 TaxID=2896847 RepID=UPI001E42B4A7|nr:hypothetical protein [Streptacidiphilus sp. ASG 303]MCD0484099.1 hypothetical protein [Streptacidiphilus sp. ASG 303]
MSIQMPPELSWVAHLAVGQGWPQGDEDRLQSLNEVWQGAARDLVRISSQLGSAGGAVLENVGGQVAEEFRTFMEQLQGSLPDLADASRSLGDLARENAVQVEYAKLMILFQLLWLAAEIAMWIYYAPEVVPALVASARAAVKMILRHMMTGIALGTAMMVLPDALIQAYQIWIKKDRTKWSVESTVQTVKSGAVSGAIGGLVFGAGAARFPKFSGSLGGKFVLGAAVGGASYLALAGDLNDTWGVAGSFTAGMAGSLSGGGNKRRFGGGAKDEAGVKVPTPHLPDALNVHLPGDPPAPSSPSGRPDATTTSTTGGGTTGGTGGTGGGTDTGTGGTGGGGEVLLVTHTPDGPHDGTDTATQTTTAGTETGTGAGEAPAAAQPGGGTGTAAGTRTTGDGTGGGSLHTPHTTRTSDITGSTAARPDIITDTATGPGQAAPSAAPAPQDHRPTPATTQTPAPARGTVARTTAPGLPGFTTHFTPHPDTAPAPAPRTEAAPAPTPAHAAPAPRTEAAPAPAPNGPRPATTTPETPALSGPRTTTDAPRTTTTTDPAPTRDTTPPRNTTPVPRTASTATTPHHDTRPARPADTTTGPNTAPRPQDPPARQRPGTDPDSGIDDSPPLTHPDQTRTAPSTEDLLTHLTTLLGPDPDSGSGHLPLPDATSGPSSTGLGDGLHATVHLGPQRGAEAWDGSRPATAGGDARADGPPPAAARDTTPPDPGMGVLLDSGESNPSPLMSIAPTGRDYAPAAGGEEWSSPHTGDDSGSSDTAGTADGGHRERFSIDPGDGPHATVHLGPQTGAEAWDGSRPATAAPGPGPEDPGARPDAGVHRPPHDAAPAADEEGAGLGRGPASPSAQPEQPEGHGPRAQDESGGRRERYQQYIQQRDAAYHERLFTEEGFQRAAGDIAQEVAAQVTRSADGDLFARRDPDRLRAIRERAEEDYRAELRDAYQALARDAGPAGVPPEQWHTARAQVRGQLERIVEQAFQLDRHLEVFKADFEQALTEFRATDLFEGRYLPAEEDPAPVREEDPDLLDQELLAPDPLSQELLREDLLKEAERTDPPATVREVRVRMQLKYLRAVDEAFHDPTPGAAAARGTRLDAHLTRLRGELREEITRLSDRERHVEHATRVFEECREDWQEDAAAGGHLGEEAAARTLKDFQQQLRAAHAALHAAEQDGRWPEHFARVTGEDSLRERLEYAQVREKRLADARRLLQEGTTRFEDDLANGAELGPAGHERLTTAWEKEVERAHDADWFGHRARHDFRVPDPDPSTTTPDAAAPASDAAAPAPPARPWAQGLERLKATLEARIAHEADLQRTLHRTAREFTEILGHPDSPAHHYVVEQAAVTRIGRDFREETITRYDELWAPVEQDTAAWLAHERHHENAFHQTVTSARTAPLRTGTADPKGSGATAELSPGTTHEPSPGAARPAEHAPHQTGAGRPAPAGPAEATAPRPADSAPHQAQVQVQAQISPERDAAATSAMHAHPPRTQTRGRATRAEARHADPAPQAPRETEDAAPHTPPHHQAQVQAQHEQGSERRDVATDARRMLWRRQGHTFLPGEVEHVLQESAGEHSAFADLPQEQQVLHLAARLARSREELDRAVFRTLLRHGHGDPVTDHELQRLRGSLTQEFGDSFQRLPVEVQARGVAAQMLEEKAVLGAVTERSGPTSPPQAALVDLVRHGLTQEYGRRFRHLEPQVRIDMIAERVVGRMREADRVVDWMRTHAGPQITHDEAFRAGEELAQRHGRQFGELDPASRVEAVAAQLIRQQPTRFQDHGHLVDHVDVDRMIAAARPGSTVQAADADTLGDSPEEAPSSLDGPGQSLLHHEVATEPTRPGWKQTEADGHIANGAEPVRMWEEGVRGGDLPADSPAKHTGAPAGPSGRPHEEQPGGGGPHPQHLGTVVAADPGVRRIGVPRASLPYLTEVVAELRKVVEEAGSEVPAHRWEELPHTLLGNYRYLVPGREGSGPTGLHLDLGPVEVLVSLDPRDPRVERSTDASPVGPSRLETIPEEPEEEAHAADAPDGAAGPLGLVPDRKQSAERFRATEVVNASMATGAVTRSRSGPTSATRGSLSGAVGIGLGPGVAHGIHANVSVSASANASSRSTTHVGDAEGGKVLDTRAEPTLVTYRPEWSFRVRTDEERLTPWEEIAARPVTVPGDERLLLWVADHHLGTPPEQVTATGVLGSAETLPARHFASPLTNLPPLFDAVVGALHSRGVDVAVGGPVRRQLARIYELDAHLVEAVQGPHGYRFHLYDGRGRPVAEVRLRSVRVPGSGRVGATSDKAHIEDVRTMIDGVSGSHAVSHSLGVSVGAGVDLLPFSSPDRGMGVSASAGPTWSRSDGHEAGRTGLYVTVPRWVGHTAGYSVEFDHHAVVSVPGKGSVTTGSVRSEALVMMPEPDAFAHGFPVDREALRPPADTASDWASEVMASLGLKPDPVGSTEDRAAPVPLDRTTVPYAPDLLRGTGRREGDPVHLAPPDHVAEGRGIGMGLVQPDEKSVNLIRDWLMRELGRRGFLPTDKDLSRKSRWSTGEGRNARIDNQRILDKFVSPRGISSHYTQIHQTGLVFRLERPSRGLSAVRLRPVGATVTIRAVRNEDRVAEFKGSTDREHVVNLSMGMDTSGQFGSGTTRFGLSLNVRSFFKNPKDGALGFEIARSGGASQKVGFLNNRPELMEYAGVVNKHVLFSDYTVTIAFQGGRPWHMFRKEARDPEPYVLHQQPAETRLLPLGYGRNGSAPSAGPTPRSVLDRAVVYFLDATGLHEAAAGVLGELAGPHGEVDAELSAFTGTAEVQAHLKEILGGAYTTDQLFDAGFFRDTFAAVDIRGDLGPTRFLDATDSPFVLGIINLWLSQASTGAFQGTSFGVSVRTSAGGSVHSPRGAGSLQGGAGAGRTWQWGTSRSLERTGGKEQIQLDFNRAYAFGTKVGFEVTASLEKHGKFARAFYASGSSRVEGRTMLFLLPEPAALEYYAADTLPLSDGQLADVLNRWNKGEVRLSGNTVAGVLSRWVDEVPEPGPRPLDETGQRTADALDSLDADRRSLARTLAALHGEGTLPVLDQGARNRFEEIFGLALQDPQDPFGALMLPEYLTREDPGGRTLGHSGVEKVAYDDGRSTWDIVCSRVDAVAPGLLAAKPDVWSVRQRRIGRLQGAVDALQGLLADGRDVAMWEDVLSPHGQKFYLVNPEGWLMSDVVEITVSDVLVSAPRVTGFRPEAGLENYEHGYVVTSQGTTRGTTDTVGPATLGGGQDHWSLTGNLGLGGGRRRGLATGDGTMTEQTVYDWNGHYTVEVRHRLTVGVRRVEMPHRPLNNRLAGMLLHGEVPASDPAPATATGTLTLKIPRGVAESLPLHGPETHDLRPLPELPGDAYVSGVLLDDAVPAGHRLLADMFGENTAGNTKNATAVLDQLLSRSHMKNQLRSASAGKRVLLAGDLFIGGKPSARARVWLHGELTDLQVLRELEGTGTGRYSKHQGGTTSSSSTGLPRLSGGVDGSGTHDPQHSSAHTAPVVDSLQGGAGAGRSTAMNVSGAATGNYRREQHVKQQGPVYLVRMRGRYRLEGERFDDHLLWPAAPASRHRSEPFTGDVYAEMFQEEVDGFRARIAEAAHQATVDERGWAALEGSAPRFALDTLVAEAAEDPGVDAWRIHQAVARRVREQAGAVPAAVVLTHDPSALAEHAHREALQWAVDTMRADLAEAAAVDPGVRKPESLGRYERYLRQTAGRPDPAGIAGTTDETTGDVIREVNRVRDLLTAEAGFTPGPVRLPGVIALTHLSHDHLVRGIAHELDAHIRLDVALPDGTVRSRWAEPSGRVHAFDPSDPGAPGRTSLSADEAQRAGLLDPSLRRDVDEVGLNADDLGEIYRTSWEQQRSFDHAVSVEVARLRERLRTLHPRLEDLFGRALAAASHWSAEAERLAAHRDAPADGGEEALRVGAEQERDARRYGTDARQVLDMLRAVVREHSPKDVDLTVENAAHGLAPGESARGGPAPQATPRSPSLRDGDRTTADSGEAVGTGGRDFGVPDVDRPGEEEAAARAPLGTVGTRAVDHADWSAVLDADAGGFRPNLTKQPDGFPSTRAEAWRRYRDAHQRVEALGGTTPEARGEQDRALSAAASDAEGAKAIALAAADMRLKSARRALEAWGHADPEGLMGRFEQYGAGPRGAGTQAPDSLTAPQRPADAAPADGTRSPGGPESSEERQAPEERTAPGTRAVQESTDVPDRGIRAQQAAETAAGETVPGPDPASAEYEALPPAPAEREHPGPAPTEGGVPESAEDLEKAVAAAVMPVARHPLDVPLRRSPQRDVPDTFERDQDRWRSLRRLNREVLDRGKKAATAEDQAELARMVQTIREEVDSLSNADLTAFLGNSGAELRYGLESRADRIVELSAALQGKPATGSRYDPAEQELQVLFGQAALIGAELDRRKAGPDSSQRMVPSAADLAIAKALHDGEDPQQELDRMRSAARDLASLITDPLSASDASTVPEDLLTEAAPPGTWELWLSRSFIRMWSAARDLGQLVTRPLSASDASAGPEDEQTQAASVRAQELWLSHQLIRADQDVKTYEALSERSTAWERVGERSTAALVMTERRSQEFRSRDLLSAQDRLRGIRADWVEKYPVAEDSSDLLERVHQHLVEGLSVVSVVPSDASVLLTLIGDHQVPLVDALARAGGREPAWQDPKEASLPARLVSTEYQRTAAAPPGSMVIRWKAGVRERTGHRVDTADTQGGDAPETHLSLSNLFPLLAHGDVDAVRLALAEATGFHHDTGLRGRLKALRPATEAHFGALIHGDLDWSDVDEVVLVHDGGASAEQMGHARIDLEDFADLHDLDFTVSLLRVPASRRTGDPGPADASALPVSTLLTGSTAVGGTTPVLGLDYTPSADRATWPAGREGLLVTDHLFILESTDGGTLYRSPETPPWRAGGSGEAVFVMALGDAEGMTVQLGGGETARLDAEESAARMAADIDRSKIIPGAPVVLLLSHGGAGGLLLPRLLAARTDRDVWAFSGPLEVVPWKDGRRLIVMNRPFEGLEAAGGWILSRPDDLGPRPDGARTADAPPPGVVVSGHAAVTDSDVVTYTIFDAAHRPVGRASHTPTDQARRESVQAGLTSTTHYWRYPHSEDDRHQRAVEGSSRPLPWVEAHPGRTPYFFNAHGTETSVVLQTGAGTIHVDGKQLGGYIRRRPSFSRLPEDSPIVLVSCSTGDRAAGSRTVATRLAASTGRIVYAPTSIVYTHLGVMHRADGGAGEWMAFHPSPALPAAAHGSEQSTGLQPGWSADASGPRPGSETVPLFGEPQHDRAFGTPRRDRGPEDGTGDRDPLGPETAAEHSATPLPADVPRPSGAEISSSRGELSPETDLYHEVNLQLQREAPGTAHVDVDTVLHARRALAADGSLSSTTTRGVAADIAAYLLGHDLPRLHGGAPFKAAVAADMAQDLKNAYEAALQGQGRLTVPITGTSVSGAQLVERIMTAIGAPDGLRTAVRTSGSSHFKPGNHKLLFTYNNGTHPQTVRFDVSLIADTASAAAEAGPSRLPAGTGDAAVPPVPEISKEVKFEIGGWFSKLMRDRLNQPVMLAGGAQIALKHASPRPVADLDFRAEIPYVADLAEQVNTAIREARPDSELTDFTADSKDKRALTGYIDGVEITIGPTLTLYTGTADIQGITVASDMDAVVDKALSFVVRTGEKQDKDLFDLLWSLDRGSVGTLGLRSGLDVRWSAATPATSKGAREDVSTVQRFKETLDKVGTSRNQVAVLHAKWEKFGASPTDIARLDAVLDDLKDTFFAGPGPHRGMLVTAANFTGDMFAVSAAMVLNPKLHVTVLAGPKHPDQVGDFLRSTLEAQVRAQWNKEVTKQLKEEARLNPDQAGTRTDPMEGDERFHARLANELARVHVHHSDDPHGLYTRVAGRRTQPLPYEDVIPPVPANLRSLHFQHAVTRASLEVATRWKAQGHETAKIRSAWGLTDIPDSRVVAFLEQVGLPVKGTHVVLWSRFSGKRGGAHPQHDTSLTGIRQLVSLLPPDTTIVLAGDRRPGSDAYRRLAAEHHNVFDMTEFWKSDAWRAHFPHGGRADQFKVFDHLARQSGSGLKHLGFRSGNLEPYALIGHNVRYLEEKGNLQATRLQDWHKHIGYQRITVSKVPTLSGQWITNKVAEKKSEIPLPWLDSGDSGAVKLAKTAELGALNLTPSDRGFARDDLIAIGRHLGFTVPEHVPDGAKPPAHSPEVAVGQHDHEVPPAGPVPFGPEGDRTGLIADTLYGGERIAEVDDIFVHSVNTWMERMSRQQVTPAQVHTAYRHLASSLGAAFTRGSSTGRQETVARHLAGLGRSARVGGAPAHVRPATTPDAALLGGQAVETALRPENREPGSPQAVDGVPQPLHQDVGHPGADHGQDLASEDAPPQISRQSTPQGAERAARLEDVLPREEWYRLQLDPLHHEEARQKHPDNPGELYDHQQSPGFQGSMNAAYERYLNDPATVGDRVDFSMYEAMHDTVGSQLKEKTDRSGAAGYTTNYPLRADSPTPSVLEEEVSGRRLMVKADLLLRFGILPDSLTWTGHFGSETDVMWNETLYKDSEVERIVDEVFDRFYEKLDTAQSPREQLKAIGWVVRTIHIIHPYDDTNRRLNVHVLLPRLLLAAGFKPVIFKDMLALFQGGRSLEQITDALESGQAMDLLSDSIEATAPQYESDWYGRNKPDPRQATGTIRLPDFGSRGSDDHTASRHFGQQAERLDFSVEGIDFSAEGLGGPGPEEITETGARRQELREYPAEIPWQARNASDAGSGTSADDASWQHTGTPQEASAAHGPLVEEPEPEPLARWAQENALSAVWVREAFLDTSGLVHQALDYRPVIGSDTASAGYRDAVRRIVAAVTIARHEPSEDDATGKGKEAAGPTAGQDTRLVAGLRELSRALKDSDDARIRAAARTLRALAPALDPADVRSLQSHHPATAKAPGTGPTGGAPSHVRPATAPDARPAGPAPAVHGASVRPAQAAPDALRRPDTHGNRGQEPTGSVPPAPEQAQDTAERAVGTPVRGRTSHDGAERTAGLDYAWPARREPGPAGPLVTDRFHVEEHTDAFGLLWPDGDWPVRDGNALFVIADGDARGITASPGDGRSVRLDADEAAALMSDDLARQDASRATPIVLVLSHSGADGPLPRLLAARTGRDVWSFSGPLKVVLQPDGSRVVARTAASAGPAGTAEWIRTGPGDHGALLDDARDAPRTGSGVADGPPSGHGQDLKEGGKADGPGHQHGSSAGQPDGGQGERIRPGMQPDRTPRTVVHSAFDVRRFRFKGEPVTDLTVRVAFRGSVDGHEVDDVWHRVRQGVEEYFNAPAHRLPDERGLPVGDRLHVTVERVAPDASPHMTVDLTTAGTRMTQRVWQVDARPVAYAHELAHQLGLRDEYRDAANPNRAHVEGSLLGDMDEPAPEGLPSHGLRGRHLQIIDTLVRTAGHGGPGGGTPRRESVDPQGDDGLTWEEIRARTLPTTREHAWVDPVSRPASSGPHDGQDGAVQPGMPARAPLPAAGPPRDGQNADEAGRTEGGRPPALRRMPGPGWQYHADRGWEPDPQYRPAGQEHNNRYRPPGYEEMHYVAGRGWVQDPGYQAMVGRPRGGRDAHVPGEVNRMAGGRRGDALRNDGIHQEPRIPLLPVEGIPHQGEAGVRYTLDLQVRQVGDTVVNRRLVNLGHSWVTIRAEKGLDKSSATYGFYPRAFDTARPLESSPGEVRRNHDDPRDANATFSREITPEQLRKALRYIEENKGRKYNLITYNCTTFVRDVYKKAVGTEAPGWAFGPDRPDSLRKGIEKANRKANATRTRR